MKVAVKNVKIVEQMSEETMCFTATLYLDGKRVGIVSNRGCGGCHRYDVGREDMQRLADYAKSLPKRKGTLGGELFTFPVDPDTLVDDAITTFEHNRLSKKNWVFLSESDPTLRLTVLKSVPIATAKHLVAKEYPDQTFHLYEPTA